MQPKKRFRELLKSKQIIVAPGAFDALIAKLIEHNGFPAVYMTGGGTASALLGVPDIGLTTMSEMLFNARRIAAAVTVPVIADADTGYGNVLNVRRTVREFEQAGVAAIHIEDQVWPKRCGHFSGKQLITKKEMCQKIAAAVEAKTDPDFCIIARTDALTVNGIDDALQRAKAYKKCGADILFVESPRNIEEIKKIAGVLGEYPLLYNMVHGGLSPYITVEGLQNLGFNIVIFPGSARSAALKAVADLFNHIKIHGTVEGYLDHMMNREDYLEFMELKKLRDLENRYAAIDDNAIESSAPIWKALKK